MPNPNLPNQAGYNTYVGARYVPVFSSVNNGQWTNTVEYEPLTIVMNSGNSYTSKTYVPIGVDINNTTYWALTGNYNAQTGALQQDVNKLKNITGISGNVIYYGADNTGTNDCTAAVKHALAAEGIAYFPPGTYLINSEISLTDNQCMIGAGASLVTLLGKGISGNGRDICLAGFTYDGNNLNPGISLDGYGFLVNDVAITKCSTDGLSISNTKTYYYSPKHGTTTLTNVYVELCGKNGISLSDNMFDVYMYHVNTRSNGQNTDNEYSAILVNAGCLAYMVNCHLWDETNTVYPKEEKYILKIYGAVCADNCQFEGGRTAIMGLFGSGSRFNSCRFYSNDGSNMIELCGSQNMFNMCRFSPKDGTENVIKTVSTKYSGATTQWNQYNIFRVCLTGGSIPFLNFTAESPTNGMNFVDVIGSPTPAMVNQGGYDRYQVFNPKYDSETNNEGISHYLPISSNPTLNPKNGDMYYDASGLHVYYNGWKVFAWPS